MSLPDVGKGKRFKVHRTDPGTEWCYASGAQISVAQCQAVMDILLLKFE